MEIVDYASDGPASWYRDVAKNVLGLVCGHPDGPPQNERSPASFNATKPDPTPNP